MSSMDSVRPKMTNMATKMTGMAASRSDLMDEIYDQFLICKICYELYKRPKTLQCLHTFCMECLEKHQDAELERSYRYLMYTRAISCPICRKKTELPSGGVRRLPENFLVANLGAVLSRRIPETKLTLCEICKPQVPASQKQASSRCLDCSKLLCNRCVELHKKTKVTQQHSLFDIEIEKDIECKVHEGEVVRFYCERCEMCICVVCTFQEHKGHEVSSFAEGMQKHQQSLDNLVDICKERIDLVKEQLDVIYKCESEIKNAEESIRDMALDTISDIHRKEQASVDTMYDLYGEDTLEFIKEKSELQEDLDKLQSTCNLTDIMVKDKGMELLLLKKEIQDKLQNLLQRQVRQPPENAMKQVKFIPGNVVFGYLSVKHPNGEAPPVESVMDEQGRELAVENGVDMLKEIDNHEIQYRQSVLKHAVSQTEVQAEDEKYTTVGNLLKQICDARTQTKQTELEDRASSPIQELWAAVNKGLSPMQSSYSSAGSSPNRSGGTSPRIRSRSSSTGVRERTTSLTPTLQRKTYSERHEDRTKRYSGHNSLRPSSFDVDELYESDFAESTVYLSTTGTSTDSIRKSNKATEMPMIMTKDKRCGTAKIGQTNRETMTKYIATLDMGVTASVPGEDKACGTRAIVTMHASSGDSDVRTQEQETETPWKEEYVKTDDIGTMSALIMVDKDMKTDPLSIHDKDTYTSWFNMVTKETETVSPEYMDASATAMPIMKSRGLNTLPLPTSDKALTIQTEFLPHKPQTTSCVSQTHITLGMDISGQPTSLLAITTSAVSCQTSPQLPSTPILMTTGSDACGPQMVHKQFGSHSVLYVEQGIATSQPDLSTKATHASPQVTEIATGGTPVETTDRSTDYIRPQSTSTSTSTSKLNVMDGSTETDRAQNSEMSTMTPLKHFQAQETSMGSNVEAMEMGINTDEAKPVVMHSSSTNTMGHESTDQQTSMDITYNDQSTHTSVATTDVGVLKRPHAMSRGVNTKRTKLMNSCTLTDGPQVADQDSMTNVSYGNKDILYDSKQTETPRAVYEAMGVGTPHFETTDTFTEMAQVLYNDRMCSPVMFAATTVDRGCSPIDFAAIIDRACSPIVIPGVEKGVNVQPTTCDTFTSTLQVKMQDTASNYDRPRYVDKQLSPVRNLISTRTKFTSTPHVTVTDRAGSPIPAQTIEIATNTRVCQYVDREGSPLPVPVTEQGIMAIADMVTKEAGTPHREYSEQATGTPVVRVMNSATEMPQISLSEKETSTVHIHVMHKNISTENIQTRDQSTSMAPGVAASYMDHVQPPSALMVTRGTCTPVVVMQTTETSPEPYHSMDRASSPVKRLTADKGITANKAVMLEAQDKFQGVGAQGKRPSSTSPRPKLAAIKEDEISSHSSDEDGSTSSKDTLPDVSPFGNISLIKMSPRLKRMKPFSPFSEGRPQMGLGFGNKERFWSSSPTLGSSQRAFPGTAMGAGMISEVRRLPPIKQLKQTETSTNTSGTLTETRSTSTTDIQKIDKAVCTESMTMQGKIGECINKLKTVRQRLEQQPHRESPIYSQASSPCPSVASDPQPVSVSTPPLLAAKSRSVDSKLDDSDGYSPFMSPNLRRRPTMSLSSASTSTSDSHSESSDQEQRTKDNKARRMRLNINQLLRSNSLPESPDPPSANSPEPPPAPENSPQVKRKLVIPQILPKMGSPTIKRPDAPRPSSAKDRPTTPPVHRERPKSATDRTKETAVERVKRTRSATARSVSRERLPKHDAKDQMKVKQRSLAVEQKPPVGVKEKPTAIPSPKSNRRAKPRPTARFDEAHPLSPTSPRNTRRLYEGIDAVRVRVTETPKQRRERLEKEMTFEDRKALTKQYFQETHPSSAGTKVIRPRSARSPRPPASEKPPRGPTCTEH